jgi:hypothetical protein
MVYPVLHFVKKKMIVFVRISRLAAGIRGAADHAP